MAISQLNGHCASAPHLDEGENLDKGEQQEEREGKVKTLVQRFNALSQKVSFFKQQAESYQLQLHTVTKERDDLRKERDGLLEAAKSDKIETKRLINEYEQKIDLKNRKIRSLEQQLEKYEKLLSESDEKEKTSKQGIKKINDKFGPLAEKVLRLRLEKVAAVYLERLNAVFVQAYLPSAERREVTTVDFLNQEGLFTLLAKKAISTWIHCKVIVWIEDELNYSIQEMIRDIDLAASNSSHASSSFSSSGQAGEGSALVVTSQHSLNRIIHRMNGHPRVRALTGNKLLQISINLEDL
ncbi:MAG: hypothetical protein ACHQUC_00900 [Chlamydiales bacterium]